MHIIEMILLISLLIVVHEAGHFFVARWLGIRVDRVGLGLPIGPTLFEKKLGDITYCIHAFLLGGYVGFPDDDPNSEIPKDDPDRMTNRPWWQKLMVVSAGVISNVIIAYLIVLFVAFSTGSLPSGKYEISVNSVVNDKAPAAAAGFEKGDKIVFVNGIKLTNPMIFGGIAQLSKKSDGYVKEDKIQIQLDKIIKANKQLNLNKDSVINPETTVTIPKAENEDYITLPEDFYLRTNKPEGEVLSDNLKKIRDELNDKTEFKTQKEISVYDLAFATADTAHPMVIEVERKGELIKLKEICPDEKGIVGIYQVISEINMPIKSAKDLIKQTNSYIYRNTYMMIDGLVKLVIGKVSPDNLHGIVAIVKLGGDTIKNSVWDGFLLTALISIDLAIINLLPIPALDGGYILFILLEQILRRPLNDEIIENISKFCFLALIILMVLIIFNDIFALITKKF